MSEPGEAPRGPDRDPLAELTPEERARAKGRLVHRLQVSFLAFLAVVCLGFLPALLGREWPAVGRVANVAIWIVGPAIPLALIGYALLRLRR